MAQGYGNGVGIITISGDVNGVSYNTTVTALRGIPLSSAVPTDGDNIIYQGGVWTTSSSTVTTISGDVTGTLGAAKVVKLQGVSISTATPTSGQVLKFTGINWTPTALPISYPPNGSAGGDLGGTYPNPTVINLQGIPVSSTAPTTGQVLEFNGTDWLPTTQTVSPPKYYYPDVNPSELDIGYDSLGNQANFILIGQPSSFSATVNPQIYIQSNYAGSADNASPAVSVSATAAGSGNGSTPIAILQSILGGGSGSGTSTVYVRAQSSQSGGASNITIVALDTLANNSSVNIFALGNSGPGTQIKLVPEGSTSSIYGGDGGLQIQDDAFMDIGYSEYAGNTSNVYVYGFMNTFIGENSVGSIGTVSIAPFNSTNASFAYLPHTFALTSTTEAIDNASYYKIYLTGTLSANEVLQFPQTESDFLVNTAGITAGVNTMSVQSGSGGTVVDITTLITTTSLILVSLDGAGNIYVK